MGRWRPAEKPGSPYITAKGAARLREEAQDLWRKQRPEVVKALSAAAAEGDRSENAEYIYRKKQLGEIDRRIRYLSKRLDEVEVVRHSPPRQDLVFFGAFVTVEDESGAELSYRIVGADEIDPARGYISVDSPMARALLGKSIDDELRVTLPSGEAEFIVINIRYST